MEIPTKYAVFDEENPNHGLKLVSLVNSPAIGFVAVQFSENKEFKLAIQNEEQRIIFTPVLVPDQLIYRELKNENGQTERFNLAFDKPTIEKVAIHFAKNGLATKADVDHSRQLIEGVVWFESTVTSSQRFGSPNGFNEIPEGTWFLTGKVYNEEVWQKIKAGEITGVSIDGVFQATESPESQELSSVARFLENQSNQFTPLL